MTFYLLIRFIIAAYEILLLIRVFNSWIEIFDTDHPVFELIKELTDPILLLSREIIYKICSLLNINLETIPIDFSPVLAFFLLELLLFIIRLFIF